MNEKIEQRSFSLSEVNESSDGFFVRGLVNQTGEWSQTLYDKHGNPFIERVMPNVFENALKRGNDVKLLLEHDKNMLLARTKDETLKLTETSRGLEMQANLVPSNQSEHIHALIKRGTLNNMSFGMVVLDAEWTKEKGVNQRSITELALYECSIVSDPAYTQSTVEARSQNIIEDVEVPNLTERNYPNMKFESMNSKQLEERKQELLSEANEIEQSKETEQRSFTPSEQLRQEAILDEVQKIKKQIESVESRNLSQRKEDVIMTNTQPNQETELRGVEQFLKGDIHGAEVRTMTTTTGAITVPTSLSNVIVEKLVEQAPLFQRAKGFTPVSGTLEVLRETNIGDATFIGEMENAETSDFTFDKITLEQRRAATAIELSQQLVNDSGINVIDYAVNVLTRRLARKIDETVLNGDPSKKQFEGILTSTKVKTFTSKNANNIEIDELLNLTLNVNSEYLKGAVFIMGREAFNKIAMSKDAQGNYHVVKDIVNDKPVYKIFGQEILIQEKMPAFKTGAISVVFVNMSEAYATMIKQGAQLKRISDDTTQALRGSHLLMLDMYCDGKILNEDAIKFLKQA
ncbi:phage major capsid protein [Bacillus toyonensis]|uniref:phage major capsid protein n=1 Tax=Bacillus toyonensis TaxID=155322 RepID=UPI000BF065CB|nr:phage major capsid protein [Bacillus toyonensis]PEK51544.1 phage major capsid protein [Bacillus toyonensis]